ncbi:Hsp70 family protein [Streptomyces sp. NPDC059568]|uniref:Hsp70 family protein n=1 Tax=Streptomyces sp. NPDC059568 TaxID=3346868 RepID=UPI0036C0BF7E
MADDTNITIIGFDLGHGDTAVTKVHAGTRQDSASLGDRNAPPEIVELGGDRKQLVTSVTVTPEGEVLVGEAAFEGAKESETFVAFKSPYLDREEVRRPLELFARRVVEEIRESRLTDSGRVRWIFGHPSGWDAEQVAGYRELLAGVCAPDEVSLVPESRAALLYARDAGDVPESEALTSTSLTASTLIVDIGSSTTDYTSIVHGTSRPVDHGNVVLGAHLIDKAVLELAIDRSPDAERIRAALAAETSRSARQVLEITCRKLKEKFFSINPQRFANNPNTGVRTTEEVFTRDGDVLELRIKIDRNDMARLLDTPQPALDGLSWHNAYRRDLGAALSHTGGEVDMILLTGGPSRMRFVQETARELAPDAQVMLGTEPEFAIARGLALAGRMDERTRGFREDVERFLATETVSDLVNERLPQLTEAMGAAVASGLTENHVIPAFTAWRRRDIVTIDGMRNRIISGVNAELDSTDNVVLNKIVTDWMAELRPELAQHTAVICRRWNLEPTALSLPEVTVSGEKMTAQVSTSVATDVLDNISTLVNVAISGVVATALFGAGSAIIMATGPFAVLFAAAAIFIGLSTAKEKIMEEIGDKDLPMAARKIRSEASMIRKLREQATEQEAALASELASQFRSDGSGRLAREITASIEKQLTSVAAEVELLIA